MLQEWNICSYAQNRGCFFSFSSSSFLLFFLSFFLSFFSASAETLKGILQSKNVVVV